MMDSAKHKVRDTLIAVGLFLVLPIMFHAYVFGNRVPIDERYTVYLPDRYVSAESWNRGEIPLWNPYVQCGVPHLGLHHVGALYPLNIIAYALLPPTPAFNLLQSLHYSLAGIFAFLLVRRLGGGFGGGLWAGIVFMFCGFLMAHETHTPMHQSAVWLPLIFYFLVRLRERGGAGFLALCALAFALQILAGYMQVAVITVLAVVLFALYDALTERRARFLLQALAAIVLGLALAAAQIVSTSEVMRQTVRARLSYEEFVQYSFPRYMFPLLAFPYLFGTHFPSLYPIKYFGPWNLHEMLGYVGTATLVLTALAFIARKRDRKMLSFWLALAVVSVLLVMGNDSPFYRIIYHVPVYNLFRAPARYWLLFGFSMAVLSGLGLGALIEEKKQQSPAFRHYVRFAAGCLLTLAVVSVVLLYSFGKVLKIARIDTATLEILRENFRIDNPAIWIPLVLMVLGAASFFFAGRVRSRWAFVPLFAVLILEFVSLHHSLFIGPRETKILFEQRRQNSVYVLLSQKEKHSYDYRVFPVRQEVQEGLPELLYPCINECYGVQSISGYGPFLAQNYSALLGMYNIGIPRNAEQLIADNHIISALNAKYALILNGEQRRDIVRAIERAQRTVNAGESVALYRRLALPESGSVSVYENVAARGRMFFASSLRPLSTVNEMIDVMGSDTVTTHGAASVLLQAPRSVLRQLGTLTSGTVTIRSYSNNRVEAETDSAGRGVVILADSFYPGWNASVDGVRTRIFRADAILRAVSVPPGHHAVTFVYEPAGFRIGLFLSMVTLAVLAFLAAISTRNSYKGRKRPSSGE